MKKWNQNAACLLAVPLALLVVMLVTTTFTGLWPTGSNTYCSYALQACAWLEGRLDVGEGYTWLELAIREGKYYVSFPPFPSLVLLPFAAVCGVNTPDHLIQWAVALLGALYAVRLCHALGRGRHAVLYALFLLLGNGFLFVALRGYVWFMAQGMCFTLSLMALFYAQRGRGGLCLALWACAVGCRPMVVLYLPMLLDTLVRNLRTRGEQSGILSLARRRWRWAVAPVLLAALYMALNQARFGSVFEFGHSFLPEFTRASEGQFSLSYAAHNLPLLFRLPTSGGEDGALQYAKFDCMNLFLIDPLIVAALLVWGHALRRRRDSRMLRFALPALLLINLLIVVCHRTLGGWQFGNRYLLDMLPYLFDGMLRLAPEEDDRLAALCTPLFAMGFAVNLIGTVATYNAWI
ncbi:MAG: hypothetical protein Q4G52_03530 [Clostridia bacterium]|nr:hypothetical protein [Clostridia bacterium]